MAGAWKLIRCAVVPRCLLLPARSDLNLAEVPSVSRVAVRSGLPARGRGKRSARSRTPSARLASSCTKGRSTTTSLTSTSAGALRSSNSLTTPTRTRTPQRSASCTPTNSRWATSTRSPTLSSKTRAASSSGAVAMSTHSRGRVAIARNRARLRVRQARRQGSREIRSLVRHLFRDFPTEKTLLTYQRPGGGCSSAPPAPSPRTGGVLPHVRRSFFPLHGSRYHSG
jgi:hypothetical protein